jgi:hypothetical protein
MQNGEESSGKPRILFLDIERVRGWAKVPVWDLSDYKHRRIHASNVEEWPRTVCAAWRWGGTKKVEFAAEWGRGGRKAFLRRVWDAYDEADIVVGHNLRPFDTKKLRTEWLLLGMKPPSPWQTVDTLADARSIFGFEYNTLASLTQRLGIPTKTDKYDPERADRAAAGDVSAQRQLKRYNCGDVVATEALYYALLPWMSGHPNRGAYSGISSCPKCGSTKLQSRGKARCTTRTYQRFQCQACGGWCRSSERVDERATVVNAR